MKRAHLVIAGLCVGIIMLKFSACDPIENPTVAVPVCSERLLLPDVQAIFTHAVEQAERLNQRVAVVIVDREGNVLGVYRMTGDTGAAMVSITRARTAAYLSSNQHAFTSLTACFITRSHFPPGVSNTPAGPLYGVGFSSLPVGDIQPNGSALNDRPGGVPIFKNGCLGGGIGISGAASSFDPGTCTGQSLNEVIALGGVIGYNVPDDKRGDNIFLDGIRLLYANASSPPGNFLLSFADLSAPARGAFSVPPQAAPAPRFPVEGEVLLGGGFDFPIRAGTILTEPEVRRIILQAAAQAAKTRAAIRRPIGSAAQVFISVVDTNGAILGIWRTGDATLFSFDVSAQKARTAVAFSDPHTIDFGRRIRIILGIGVNEGLAITTRAIGFLSQDFFPPGIDRNTLGNPVERGPLFEGPDFAYQQRLGLSPYGNGITIFPGGIPLYKGMRLVGAIGISGDGIDQDDLIASAGAVGFEPPTEIRSDQFFFHDVRLPYIKIPRRPEL